MVITASADGTARIWEAGSADEIARFAPPGRARVAGFSPDGLRVIIGNDDGSAVIYDLPRDRAADPVLARMLRCRVPFFVNGDHLQSRPRVCE
jgi:WD40 repeat protein